MNTDDKPLSPLYYDDYLEKKIRSLHMDNVILEKEIKTLRETN